EEHHGNLLGPKILADQGHPFGRPQDALDGSDRSLLLEVVLGFLAERDCAVAPERDHGRRPPLTFTIGDYLRVAELKVGNHRVAGSEINSNVGHASSWLFLKGPACRARAGAARQAAPT